MSGWDVSSTPTWGSHDGPDETQGSTGRGDGSSRDFGPEFGAQDFGRGPSSPAGGFPEAGGGYPGEGQAGGPPPEFFGQDYGQEHEVGPGGFPQRTPGRSFQDLPRREARGRHSSAPGGGYGQDNGYGHENGYGQDNGFGHQEPAFGHQEGGFGHENGYGQEGAFGQPDQAFGQPDDAFGQPEGGFGHQENGFGHQEGGFGQESNSYGQDAAYGNGWGGNAADQADTWGPGGGQDNDGGWGRPAGRSAAPWEERPQQDAGYPGPDGPQDFGQQDFGRQDYTRQAPRPDFGARDYDGQDFGQQGPDQGFDPSGRDVSAQMDPALQDFFAPQRGGAPGYPGPGPGPGRPGDRDSRYRPPTDGWEDPGRPRGGTGPRPAPRGPRRDDPEPRRGGLGMRGLIAIGVVVAVIIVIAVVVLTRKSGNSTPAASNTPSGGTATTPAAKPSASKGAATGTGTKTSGGGTAAAAGAFTLSTPATAGGYPLGQDPNFLATTTATAKQITEALSSGGGGTVTGNPVSAAYQLPLNQVITFVGYQGTFTPAKVATILASLASDPHTYAAGPNGGVLGCGNTKATPSAAVCFWATGTTLGITEFFTATGPETLNAAQPKGAADTLNLRGGVEKKK